MYVQMMIYQHIQVHKSGNSAQAITMSPTTKGRLPMS